MFPEPPTLDNPINGTFALHTANKNKNYEKLFELRQSFNLSIFKLDTSIL